MKLNRSKRMQLSKKQYTISITLVIAILAGIVIMKLFIINSDDRAAKASLVVVRENVIGLTTTFNKHLADAMATRQDKIVALADYNSGLQKQRLMVCESQKNLIYYNFVPSHGTCESYMQMMTDISTSVTAVGDYVKDDTAMGELLPKMTNSLTLHQSYDQWQSAIASVTILVVSNASQPIKTKLLIAMTSYRDAYKALIDADSKKDADAFTKAEQSLATAHLAFIASANDSKQNLVNLTDRFTLKYQQFLKQFSQ